MLPHAGARSAIFSDICALGGHLEQLGEVRGTQVAGAQVAMLHDNEAGWALRSGLKPINNPSYAASARALHNCLFERAVTVDVLPAWSPLGGYKLVVVPGLFLVSDENARAVAEFAEAGGTVLVTWFSGIVDPVNAVRTGGFPGAFRKLLGVVSEEFYPLDVDESVELDNGWRAKRWTELMRTDGADVVAGYASGDVAGHPAITRRTVGAGSAWYLSADLDEASLGELADLILAESAVTPAANVSPGVEAVRRSGESSSYLFLINHSDDDGWAQASGVDLLTGLAHVGRVELKAGSVAVIRE
jgi:beta-galactosidase